MKARLWSVLLTLLTLTNYLFTGDQSKAFFGLTVAALFALWDLADAVREKGKT
jgi:hypothetical protein